MRDFALIFSALFLSGAQAPEPVTQSPRIVSTSLCSDTYVLEQIPHDQIAALSWQAGDAVSTAPLHLQNKPKAWDDVERLLALKPTLVVFGPGEGLSAKPVLQKAGIKTVEIEWAHAECTIDCNRQKLADVLGRTLNPVDDPVAIAINPPQVLYLSRAGGTAGPGTYVDTAISDAGGINIIKTPGWFTPDPEVLAGVHPDLIVTSFFDQGYESINANGLRHGLMRDKLDTTPHVNVPGALWPCPGPGLVAATEIITQAIEDMAP